MFSCKNELPRSEVNLGVAFCRDSFAQWVEPKNVLPPSRRGRLRRNGSDRDEKCQCVIYAAADLRDTRPARRDLYRAAALR
jgi:hypothetical protein